MAISKTERTELRRIVKNRFTVLREQITVRQNEIANEIRKEITANHQSALDDFTAKFDDLRERALALNRESEDLIRDMKQYGIETDGNRYGLEMGFRTPTLRVTRLHETVDARIRELKKTAGSENLNLSMMEMELDEKIALDALESDTAREFIKQIPTVEKLLPLPSGQKGQLTA